jgi:signal recognition particle GTPase
MGSGSSIADVNRLLSQFEDMQKMMKAVSQSQNNPVQRLRGMKMPNFKIPTGFKR